MPNRDMAAAKVWIRDIFPTIPEGHFKVTSDPASYNCISWAAEDRLRRWWWPAFGKYWPDPPVPFVNTIPAFIAAFQTLDYQPCDFDEAREPGYDKVAIYETVYGLEVRHMARQLHEGPFLWTSKLGAEYDISHKTLADIEGPSYGHVVQMLKKPRPQLSLVKKTRKRRRRR